MSSEQQFADTLTLSDGSSVRFYSLAKLGASQAGLAESIAKLPVSVKVLLESMLRNIDGRIVALKDVEAMARWDASAAAEEEIPFFPARVILQDFTGVPAVVDLAALRNGCKDLGGDVARINPLVPIDLVIDHSFQVDEYGRPDSLTKNLDIEFERNMERYQFLKWGQQAFKNFRVVPPATGIVHQVNLEYLATVVVNRDGVAFPDSLVGTDSHTTMVNGLGVTGWGVGGIEAEAVMLGQPIYMLPPPVVGLKLVGRMPETATATDLVLTVTQLLRNMGVVEQFVEFYGEGAASLSLPDRATVANMAPEYGATMGYFPVDSATCDYLRLTGRSAVQVELVEKYCKAQGLWRDDAAPTVFSRTATLDLSTVQPCLAGPKRPQDRVLLSDMKKQWTADLGKSFGKNTPELASQSVPTEYKGEKFNLRHGDVVIAAITSCTNTSNPDVLIAAGLLARNAVRRGLNSKPWVKTSLAPGSGVVLDYLAEAGLAEPLNQIGFYAVGMGCGVCIGNSGPLPPPIAESVSSNDMVVASVLSGNRNFEGRVNEHVKANYLASPPLVVAYALAGTVNIDLSTEPIGVDSAGVPVMLSDIWPPLSEVRALVPKAVHSEQFSKRYAHVSTGPEQWQKIHVAGSELYDWPETSTYIRQPPFFQHMSKDVQAIQAVRGARVLVMVGDSVTTDHISPAGSIPRGPAAAYLNDHGIERKDFNSFGARRGNHEVMMRGTFANIRIKNLIAPGTEGGYSTYLPSGERMFIYEAAEKYMAAKTPLMVLAGKDYGMGSSRDWAAKGTYLLGVHAVLAVSYERIHRSNLVGMGVLPLQFKAGESAASHGLTGREVFDVQIDDTLHPRQDVVVTATDPETGVAKTITAVCRIDTNVEVDYFRNGGILHTVLRRIAAH